MVIRNVFYWWNKIHLVFITALFHKFVTAVLIVAWPTLKYCPRMANRPNFNECWKWTIFLILCHISINLSLYIFDFITRFTTFDKLLQTFLIERVLLIATLFSCQKYPIVFKCLQTFKNYGISFSSYLISMIICRTQVYHIYNNMYNLGSSYLYKEYSSLLWNRPVVSGLFKAASAF